MKKTFATLLFSLVFSQFIFAQTTDETTISSKLKILVLELDEANSKIQEFVSSKKIVPESFYQSKDVVDFTLLLDYDDFVEIEKLMETLGYIYQKNTSSVNYTEDIEVIDRDILILEKERDQYKKLVENKDLAANDRSFDYWEKIITIEKKIEEEKLSKVEVLKKHKKYSYDVHLIEEGNSTQDYSSSWINMPGIEYSMLTTEQPEIGVSPEKMQGAILKYMFNYGKSYAILGLYRSMDSNITTEIDETYIFGLGQDFYSKRMGRGQRKFFNLYTSFNIGVYVSTGENQKVTSWFTNPFFGLEIFKNKFFLVDTKVGYFLPYQNSRTQRGLLYNASLNFVF